eukprot:gnl/Hemi2/10908_TR3743_c0_g1_i1.p1 gnl/Hemi2/10908_TR3743_c0_g1~~gnl/Hemi2/10908_TR3743_c0_g1_i1.p1  ORF type:complete len:279 (+),score=75.73 gnl/Hemi2/10908_TR3743_c0_g1_i1:97-933(+)
MRVARAARLQAGACQCVAVLLLTLLACASCSPPSMRDAKLARWALQRHFGVARQAPSLPPLSRTLQRHFGVASHSETATEPNGAAPLEPAAAHGETLGGPSEPPSPSAMAQLPCNHPTMRSAPMVCYEDPPVHTGCVWCEFTAEGRKGTCVDVNQVTAFKERYSDGTFRRCLTQGGTDLLRVGQPDRPLCTNQIMRHDFESCTGRRDGWDRLCAWCKYKGAGNPSRCYLQDSVLGNRHWANPSTMFCSNHLDSSYNLLLPGKPPAPYPNQVPQYVTKL